MSNSGSTYKDSFTIRYDNPTDTNRDTSLFELGSDNPNRAIPFPIGSFLGTGEDNTPFLSGDEINFTNYFNTGNKIITTTRTSPASGDETQCNIYDLQTGTWQGGTSLGVQTDVVCKPIVIPKLAFTNPITFETGFFEGLVNVVEHPLQQVVVLKYLCLI